MQVKDTWVDGKNDSRPTVCFKERYLECSSDPWNQGCFGFVAVLWISSLANGLHTSMSVQTTHFQAAHVHSSAAGTDPSSMGLQFVGLVPGESWKTQVTLWTSSNLSSSFRLPTVGLCLQMCLRHLLLAGGEGAANFAISGGRSEVQDSTSVVPWKGMRVLEVLRKSMEKSIEDL